MHSQCDMGLCRLFAIYSQSLKASTIMNEDFEVIIAVYSIGWVVVYGNVY